MRVRTRGPSPLVKAIADRLFTAFEGQTWAKHFKMLPMFAPSPFACSAHCCPAATHARSAAIACAFLAAIVLSTRPTTACAQDAFTPPSAQQAKEAQLLQRIDALEKRVETNEKAEKSDSQTVSAAPGPLFPASLPLPLPVKGALAGLTFPSAETPAERVLGVMNGQEMYVSQGVVLHREVPKPPVAPAKKARQP